MSARIRNPQPNRPRVLAASLAIALSVSPLAAGGGLEDFYNSVTAYHNVTAPQSIKGQAAHIYTGGSLYTRTPNRTYSLASFSPPSLRAGCGGIDAFGGAFSFINADEFVQMLRNIGQNALGLFFYTALQAMAPEIAEINKDLKNLAQRVNALNINSCEMAKHLVDASGIERMRDTNTRTSFYTALKKSLFSDAAEGQAKVFGDDAKAQQTQNAVKSDPDANARLIMGNLVWRAMNRGGLKSFLGEKEMRMAMSAVGAVVFSRAPSDPENAPPKLTHKPRTLTFQRLLGKGSGADGEASKPKIITCVDGAAEDQCTVMGEEDYDGKPFADLAAEKMGEIYQKIRNRQALTTEQIAFVNATSVPVYRMLAVAATYEPDSVAHAMIKTYSDVIGAELAAAFVLKALDEVEKALWNRKYEGAESELKALADFKESIFALRQEIVQQRIAYTNKINSMVMHMQEINHLEKAYMNNLSDRVTASLRFSRRMRGYA